MSNDKSIKLYSTYPHPCSYFRDREAKTLFVDPHIPFEGALYTQLSRRGFRRSGRHVYRPDCQSCQQCIATRIPVARFTPSRKQRRCQHRNADLKVVVKQTMADNAYALYERYIRVRHQDGDMFPPSREQFEQFLCDTIPSTRFACFYLQDTLIAVSVIDVMGDGLSAIYTFYDPDADYNRRSLGAMAILWMVEHCRELSLPYVYLGYWIRDCAKMRYKTDYRPLELFMSNRWIRLN
ncbi:arginyltransferase [Spongiibacter taiwanensis]|uniref:arginyltransferase n=1 Tax=Spongiibacter taiwanensis TaxID=1748242 RepID=UPI0020355BBF|nr:arginyltransferase [Spongiibacter taiwanensis]USA43447.1 arginyltransferase [Spongiibacter taiwanensis]